MFKHKVVAKPNNKYRNYFFRLFSINQSTNLYVLELDSNYEFVSTIDFSENVIVLVGQLVSLIKIKRKSMSIQ